MSTERKKHILPVLPWNKGAELTWFEYRSGYKRAADALVLNVLNDDETIIDEFHLRFGMVYPIMFLYRHYIEIEFKDLIAIRGFTNPVDTKKNFKHDLKTLWLKVLECVEVVRGVDARREFEGTLERIVEFFVKFDPDGDRFRYPKNTKGNSQWDKSFEINIATVKAEVNRLEQYCYELRSELKQLIDPEATDMSERDYSY
jgi:hypothetical protein